MENKYILQRLEGIQQILNGIHKSSGATSSATSGREREGVIDSFLSAVFPNQFRFGTGDATDSFGNKSGQLDVVIENSFSPSLPMPGTSARLYPAESIAAVVEVKSTLDVQWKEVVETANKLAVITKKHTRYTSINGGQAQHVPLFVIGYTGWSKIETLEKKIHEAPNVGGILVIDSGLFCSSSFYGELSIAGPWALWGFIKCLHETMNKIANAQSDLMEYQK